MGDMGEMWRDHKEARKEKKEANQESSTEILNGSGVKFESKNFGRHLIIQGEGEKVDFWPSTGKWIVRNGREGRGVRKLLKYLGVTVETKD